MMLRIKCKTPLEVIVGRRSFACLNLCFVLLGWFLSSTIFSADNASLVQTKNKIEQLDTHIHLLQKNLSIVNDKHGLLTRELGKNEKAMSLNINKLRQTQEEISHKQQQINQARHDSELLHKKLLNAQHLLQEQVRIRYKMGESQSIGWLLHQEKVSSLNHVLTLHQYFLESYKKSLNTIAATQSELTKNQVALALQISQQKTLWAETKQNQAYLEHNKKYHQTLIKTLQEEIQSKEARLNEFERNKKNLSQLLKTLTDQSITQTSRPFRAMQHKLPHPVHQTNTRIEKTAQGLTFFAKEGSPIYAVHPGKIVFSDWLNGYGLLLIIDHGQGFMTLYAHNQSLYKHTGETVLLGQAIATVGHSGGIHASGLYFEVRHNGKAVLPLQWLAKTGI